MERRGEEKRRAGQFSLVRSLARAHSSIKGGEKGIHNRRKWRKRERERERRENEIRLLLPAPQFLV